MNDPQIFRKRRLDRLVDEELARHWGDGAAALRAVRTRVLADPALKKAVAAEGLARTLAQGLERHGYTQGADGVWCPPRPPCGAA